MDRRTKGQETCPKQYENENGVDGKKGGHFAIKFWVVSTKATWWYKYPRLVCRDLCSIRVELRSWSCYRTSFTQLDKYRFFF